MLGSGSTRSLVIAGAISLIHGGKQVASLLGIVQYDILIYNLSVTSLHMIHAELGGIAIAPHPELNLKQLKPGFVMKPSFGVIPHLIDKDVCSYTSIQIQTCS